MGPILPADAVSTATRPTDVSATTAVTGMRGAAAATAPEFAPDKAPALRASSEAGSTPDAFRKFEAMMLQSFLQSMLPEKSEAVYGEGLAGDMWRSMMAEQIAGVMAERGGIGVADRILAGYYGTTAEQPMQNPAEADIAIESALHEARRMALQPAVDAAAANRSDF